MTNNMNPNTNYLTNNLTNYTNTIAGNTTTPHHMEEVVSKLWIVLGLIVLILGTVGHFLTMLVICSSRSMRVHSTSVYLLAMAIAGILALYSGLLRYIVLVGFSNYEMDIREIHLSFCKVHAALTYALLQYIAWIQATISIDRLISVVLPHGYSLSCGWKAGLTIALVEAFIALALNSFVMVTMDFNQNGYCVFIQPTLKDAWGYIDLAFYSLIPATIMLVCNTGILGALRASKAKLGGKNTLARSITTMLMSLNLLFLITTLPISVIFFLKWGPYGSMAYFVLDVTWTAFSLLQYIGSAATFPLYCMTGSKFREEMFSLFSCCRVKKKAITNDYPLSRKTNRADSVINSARYKCLSVVRESQQGNIIHHLYTT